MPIHELTKAGTSESSFVELFLQGRSVATIRSYRSDLADFAIFLGTESLHDAALRLLADGPASANVLVLRYLNALRERGLKSATQNRRLASLRSLVSLARTVGLVNWALEVRGPRTQPYRDTRGPGLDGVRRVLKQLGRRRTPKAIRDIALVRLLFDLALRSNEVLTLDVEHLDREHARLHVLRKGRSERELITLPEGTLAAVVRWLDVRGDDPGPLFINVDRAGKGQRLSANGLYRLIRRLGQDIGCRLRPHALRHAAITVALDLTSGDVRNVAKFSSHRSLETVLLYDDARTDAAGEIAKMVAEAVS